MIAKFKNKSKEELKIAKRISWKAEQKDKRDGGNSLASLWLGLSSFIDKEMEKKIKKIKKIKFQLSYNI